ncbi:helix-hairpin-helix domain-containing protein [Paenibacillus polysaccharolyticus]|uniref:ComEA family DNA-binding protein n=1 Tax=Paenibacillus polysaccharolyticus TaxID=582692 RepID=UPI0030093B9B
MRLNKALSIAAAVVGCVLILWSGKSEQPPSGWEPMQLGSNQPTSEQNSSAIQSAALVPENVADAAPKDGVSGRQLDDAAPAQESKVREPNVAPAVSGNAPAQPQAQVNESRSSVSEAEATSKPADETTSETADHGKIDVNTAPVNKLTELPGIGQKKAQAIVEYRNAHGPFAKVSDLTKVKGIGMKMLQKMAPYVQIR